MKVNPKSRYNDAFTAADRIDTSSVRAPFDIKSFLSRLRGEPAERYEDYFRHAALVLASRLLATILFSPDLEPERSGSCSLRSDHLSPGYPGKERRQTTDGGLRGHGQKSAADFDCNRRSA
jgi:hypothetical protein